MLKHFKFYDYTIFYLLIDYILRVLVLCLEDDNIGEVKEAGGAELIHRGPVHIQLLIHRVHLE